MSKKEIDTINERFAREKAAELKAKLAMVELKDKPKYGRAPRKIGMIVCDTGIKTGYREERAQFVLRLDEKAGEFIAEHGDFWYVSKSRDALQAKMDEVARVTLDLEWTRYILVKYEARIPSRSSWHSGTTDLKVDDKRPKDVVVLGIELQWDVLEFSNAIHLPGDDGDRFMKREVDEDGNSAANQESVSELPAGLVPYTKDREELLKSIRAALASIDKKMVELLSGTPEQVAKRLDAANGTLLLAAPPTEKKGKRS